MDAILNFLADNYFWFMIGAGVLLIALVGFIVDGKKKKEGGAEVPQNTTNLNQANAMNQMQNTEAVPTQPDQSIVFEQPSLNTNETINALSENNSEPSLTFETNESQPVDFSNPMVGVATTENSVVDNGGVMIGEPIEAPSTPQNEIVIEEPGSSVVNETTPTVEVTEAPAVEAQPITMETPEVVSSEIPVTEMQPISSEVVSSEIPVTEMQSIPTETPEVASQNIPVLESQPISMDIPTIPATETPEVPVAEVPVNAETQQVATGVPETPVVEISQVDNNTTPIA